MGIWVLRILLFKYFWGFPEVEAVGWKEGKAKKSVSKIFGVWKRRENSKVSSILGPKLRKEREKRERRERCRFSLFSEVACFFFLWLKK